MRRSTIGTIAVLALTLLAACGDDKNEGGNLSSEEQEYVDAMMSTFDADDAGMSEEDGRCVAEEVISVVGVDELKEAGITPEDIENDVASDELLADYQYTEEQADGIINGVFDCVDFGALMVEGMAGSGVDLPADKVECLGDKMEKSEAFRSSLKADMLDVESDVEGDMQAEIIALFGECDVDLSDLMGS